MRTRPITKAFVALASILALFALSATPAGAGGPYPFTVTGGTLVAAGNSFDLTPGGGGGGTPPCADKADTTALSASGNAAAGTWSISGSFTTFFRLGTPPAGPWYQADITLVGAGSYTANPTPPPPYLLATTGPNHLTFQARIYEVPPCDKSVLKCIITGRLAGTGTFTGTLPNAVSGDTFTFNAATNNPGGLNMVTSSCGAPFVSWNGQVATVTALTGSIT